MNIYLGIMHYNITLLSQYIDQILIFWIIRKSYLKSANFTIGLSDINSIFYKSNSSFNIRALLVIIFKSKSINIKYKYTLILLILIYTKDDKTNCVNFLLEHFLNVLYQ